MIGRRSSQREINDDSEEVYVNEAHSGKGMGSCEEEGEEDEDHLLGADLLLVLAPDNCPAPQTINQGVR